MNDQIVGTDGGAESVASDERATHAAEHNPWLERFGCFADDPTFDDFQAEIAAYRETLDESAGTDDR